MVHPLLQLIATQPQLLADHAEAYAEMAAAEVGKASTAWQRKALLNLLAVFSFGATLVLAGVALMLWAVTPVDQIHAAWAMILVPSLPLGAAILCRLASKSDTESGAFDNLRRQVRADLGMLREAGVQ